MRVWRAVAVLAAVAVPLALALGAVSRGDAPPLQVHEVASGFENPWSLAFLPDGRMLVTERPGRLRIVARDGTLGAPLGGLPEVHARGQGGLHDIVLAPDHADSDEVFFCYAEPRGEGKSGTAIARARLTQDRLEHVQVIFRQQPAWEGAHHYGCRLVFAPDGLLFATLGERNQARALAQRLDNHMGKVIRIRADGTVPADNPFVDTPDALPEIWSYGHRNPQGAALHPQTGALWTHEHGPRGGDEVNIARPGRNYGWPVITYGREYSGGSIGEGTAREGMEQPLHHWVPSIAPSGMSFYTAGRFPQWRGALFVGSLKFGMLVKLTLDGERIVSETRVLEDLGRRIRDVRQGPDGYLYLLTDESDARLLRVGAADGA